MLEVYLEVIAKYYDQLGNELAPQETIVSNGLENAVYSVEPKAIAGYELIEMPANATGRVIGNKTIEVLFIYRELKTFEVKKVWADSNHMLNNVTVHILANGVETGNPIVLDESNNWKQSVTMPILDAQGNPITYSVKEDDYENYISSVSGNLNEGFTVTNTIIDKVSIPVTKTWVGTPTDSVTVNLYADGKKVDSQKLSKDNNWQYTFTNLKKYKDGKEIVYTVEEEKVAGYTTKITGDAKLGYVITNTKETPKTADDHNITMYGTMLVTSLLAAILVVIKKKSGLNRA